MLDIEITVAKIENNKAPGGGEVTVYMTKTIRSIGMQWIMPSYKELKCQMTG
jgi:hypothetical protein